MSSIDEKSQQCCVSYNQQGNYFCIGRLFDNAGQFDSADSGGFRYCGAPGRKHLRDPRFKIFINLINLQVIFRQNSNASKLRFVVASDESFVSFLYINEVHRKMAVFLQKGGAFFYKYVLEMFWLSWKTTQKYKSRLYSYVFLRHN